MNQGRLSHRPSPGEATTIMSAAAGIAIISVSRTVIGFSIGEMLARVSSFEAAKG
jgi:hypothetical protein